MNSAIFLCFSLFCCVNLVRPAPVEEEETETLFEKMFKRGYGGYGYGGYGYGGGSSGSGEGNIFAKHCL